MFDILVIISFMPCIMLSCDCSPDFCSPIIPFIPCIIPPIGEPLFWSSAEYAPIAVARTTAAIVPKTKFFINASLSFYPKFFKFHRNGWRRSWRSILTISFLDECSDLFQSLALVHHFHHVPRDDYADGSARLIGSTSGLFGGELSFT